MMKNKMLLLGLAGAVGCLAGWMAGELLLLLGLPESSKSSAPSLVAKPELVDEPTLGQSTAPEVPKAPQLPGQESAKTAEPPAEIKRLLEKYKGQKYGDVRITLHWKNYNDLDLHCIDPSGEEICYRHKTSASGGKLDVDKNVSPETNNAIENIYWPIGGAPKGTYRILVNHYNHHANRSPSRTPFDINVAVEGKLLNVDGVITHGQPKREIHRFTLRSGIYLAAPEKMEIFQGGTNRLKVKVARARFTGPVQIESEGASLFTVKPVLIPAGQDEAEVEVKASSRIAPGEHLLGLRASGGGAEASASVKVDVKSRPPVIVLAAPPRIEVGQGGENRMLVRVARSQLDQEVTIRATDVPEGVVVEKVSLRPGQTETEIRVKVSEEAKDGTGSFRLEASVGNVWADSSLQLQVHPAAGRDSWSWWIILLIALWTALLAIGLSCALVAIQNRYLHRPWMDREQFVFLLKSAALVGMVSGGLGQIILMALTLANLLPQIGFVLGWVLLGSLLGYGLAYFIPNLDGKKAALAGGAGGLAGSLTFVLVTLVAGDVIGRFLGALLLGLSIGLMVAFVELTFRKAWLEVRYGASEIVTVNLGPEPVKVGSDGSACAVYAKGAAPVAFRFWIHQGKVLREDYQAKDVQEVQPDESQEIGAITVTVRGETDSGESKSKEAVSTAPTPPIEPQAEFPPPQEQKEKPEQRPSSEQASPPPACPGCKRRWPGTPGDRHCQFCDIRY